MSSLTLDLKYALRTLRRSPGYGAVALVTLTLGIGANTAIFSVIRGVLLRPLPYDDAPELVRVWELNHEGRRLHAAWRNFEDWREARSFAALGATPVAVVSERFWRRHMGATPDPGSRTFRVSAHTVEVVGVLPDSLAYPVDADIWYPLELTEQSQDRTSHNYSLIGRLADGVAPGRAKAELDRITRGFLVERPGALAGISAPYFPAASRVEPLLDATVGEAGRPLWILLSAATLLLLIACTNLASMTLARAATREREVAVRNAIHGLDPDVPAAFSTIEQRIGDTVTDRRFTTLLLGGFAAVGLLLALIGIYGVVSFSVARRTREMGIRLALGAPPRAVRALVQGRIMTLAAAGVVAGSVAALGATRLMTWLVYEVSPADPTTFAAVALVMAAAAWLAAWVPARRSSRVDPLVTMRAE